MPLNPLKHEALARQEVADALDDWPGTKPKTAPNIADAVIERMKNRPGEKRVFDRASLKNFIFNKKLTVLEKTPSLYKLEGRSGAELAALPAEELTRDIKVNGQTVGVASLYVSYEDKNSHPKGLRMSPHIFMIDPEKKTQDTLEKCRELAIRDALILLSLRKKNKQPQHEGLINAIDDAERKEAVMKGAEELKKQTEYTTHYHGLLARLAPGVSHVVTPAEGLPYVYITTDEHYGKKFFDLSDEGIKKAAEFALEHSTKLQDHALLAEKAEKLANSEITPREAGDNIQYLPHLAFGRSDHASVDIDAMETDEAPAATHESADIDEPTENDAAASSRASPMQMPAPPPREDGEDAGAAAQRGHTAKRPRATPTPTPAPGVVCDVGDVVGDDDVLVPRDRYDAVVAARDDLAQKLADVTLRLSQYELVGVETDAFGLGPVDPDLAAWERLRRALGRVPRTYFTQPTGDSLPYIREVGRTHSQELSILCQRTVRISFEQVPAHFAERVGTELGTKRALEEHYWRARDSLPDDFVYGDLRDRVHDTAVASRLLHELVYRRIGLRLPRNDECDAYVCTGWRLGFLVIGEMATPAGLVLRPTALHNMWRDMNYLPEIVRYYGVACFTAAAAGIAEPLSHARRKERSGHV